MAFVENHQLQLIRSGAALLAWLSLVVFTAGVDMSFRSPYNRTQEKLHLEHNANQALPFLMSLHQPLMESEAVDRFVAMLSRHDRDLIPKFRPLCRTTSKWIQFDNSVYEYNPRGYLEVRCENAVTSYEGETALHGQCAYSNFVCVQVYHTLHVTEHRPAPQCYNDYTIDIPSGCECMWPEEALGTIETHY